MNHVAWKIKKLPSLSLLLVAAIILGQHWIRKTSKIQRFSTTFLSLMIFIIDSFYNGTKVTFHLRTQLSSQPSKSTGASGMSETTKTTKFLYSAKGVYRAISIPPSGYTLPWNAKAFQQQSFSIMISITRYFIKS